MDIIRLWEPPAIERYKRMSNLFLLFFFGYCRGGLYNLIIRELQTTETELRCIQSE